MKRFMQLWEQLEITNAVLYRKTIDEKWRLILLVCLRVKYMGLWDNYGHLGSRALLDKMSDSYY